MVRETSKFTHSARRERLRQHIAAKNAARRNDRVQEASATNQIDSATQTITASFRANDNHVEGQP